MEEEKVVRAPKNTWEMLWWMVFEPELLQNYSQSLTSIRLRANTILKSFLVIALCTLAIWFLLNAVLVILDYPFWFANKGNNKAIIENWIEHDFPSNYLLFCTEKFTFLFIGFFCCFIFCLLTVIAADQPLGLVFCLFFTFSFCAITLITPILLPSLAQLYSNIVKPFHDLLNIGKTARFLMIEGAVLRSIVFGAFSGLLATMVLGFPRVSIFCWALGISYGMAIFFEEVSLTNPVYAIVVGLFYTIPATLALSFGTKWFGGLVGGLVYGSIFSTLFLLRSDFVLGQKIQIAIIYAIWYFLMWAIMFYRAPLTLYYSLKNYLGKYSLSSNPYLWDAGVFLPVWQLKEVLTLETIASPEDASTLIQLLLNKRKYQRPLAHHLLHAQTSGYWRKNRLQPDILKVFVEVPDDKDKKFRPSAAWYEKLHAMRQARMDSARQNNIHSRLQYFDRFRQKLAEFRQQNLVESPVWNHYYFDTLDLWVKSADAEYERLKLESQNQEPVCPNLYRGGEQLDPRYDKALFFGREDLRNTFESKVVTAASMPLFFIQGQRRVGKSSLIRFLPEFLDSGFVLVYLDLQTGINSIPEWLEYMRRAVWKTVRKKEQAPPLPNEASWDKDDWLASWRIFQQELKTMANEDGRRIILAMDEYEELHRCLQSDPEQGGQLLGAMRSFSQGQNRVVFLFAGADYLTELKNPNWNEYFVQAVPLTVGYLSKEDTFRLIQVVPLQYPPALLERMYHDTQGHPCLLQKICQEMVNIANASGKKEMAETDYDAAIRRVVMQPHNGVVDVFWGQYCTLRDMKQTVWEILHGKPPSDERQVKVMKIHGFVMEENGEWRLRVPLFERWVREFGDL